MKYPILKNIILLAKHIFDILLIEILTYTFVHRYAHGYFHIVLK